MPNIIKNMGLTQYLKNMNNFCTTNVFATRNIRDQSATVAGLSWNRAVIRPQGSYKPSGIRDIREKEIARQHICTYLSVPSNTKFILSVGFGDYRKGVDAFVETAKSFILTYPEDHLHFVWLGDIAPDMQNLVTSVQELKHIHFIPLPIS